MKIDPALKASMLHRQPPAGEKPARRFAEVLHERSPGRGGGKATGSHPEQAAKSAEADKRVGATGEGTVEGLTDPAAPPGENPPTSPFAKPSASFDQPSVAFADFLGAEPEQNGAAPDQASTFGAKGMFGSATVGRRELAMHYSAFRSEQLTQSLAEGRGLDLTAETGAGPQSGMGERGGAQGDPVAAMDQGPMAALELTGAAGAPTNSAGRLAPPADIEAEAVSTAEPVQMSETPIHQSALSVVVADQEGAVDVVLTMPVGDKADRSELRDLVLRTLAEHGEQPGTVRLNGEPLIVSADGGRNGRFTR